MLVIIVLSVNLVTIIMVIVITPYDLRGRLCSQVHAHKLFALILVDRRKFSSSPVHNKYVDWDKNRA